MSSTNLGKILNVGDDLLNAMISLKPTEQMELFELCGEYRYLIPWLVDLCELVNDALSITLQSKTAPPRLIFPPEDSHETIRLACWAANLPEKFSNIKQIILRTALDRGCETLIVQ